MYLRRLNFLPKLKSLSKNMEKSSTLGNRNISRGDGNSREHLDVTSDQERQSEIHNVEVTRIEDISPTVKKLILTTPVKPVPFHFKAGQWVDFFIPNVEVVGGFSMTSSPSYLKKTGNLELCVKYSSHPPAHWVHTKCQVGSQVSIRIGGHFFLDTKVLSSLDEDMNILLIGGGVGINPLCAMVNEIADSVKDDGQQGTSSFLIRTSLLFSAKTLDELLFRDKFQDIAKQELNFKTRYFLTGGKVGTESQNGTIEEGRIGVADITRVLENDFKLPRTEFHKSQAYICGPTPMIIAMENILKSLGVSKIFYEKWWISNET